MANPPLSSDLASQARGWDMHAIRNALARLGPLSRRIALYGTWLLLALYVLQQYSSAYTSAIVKYKAATSATSPLMWQLLYNNSRHHSLRSTSCDARDEYSISKMRSGKLSSPNHEYRTYSVEEVCCMACGGYNREVQRNASNLLRAGKSIESARCAERGGRPEGWAYYSA